MITATLRRTESGDTGTFGVLQVGSVDFATGELPDRGNADDISSIPAGTYTCSKTFSPRFQRPTYEILNVPGRTGIRIHPANFMGDKTKGLQCELDGCIALGMERGVIEGQDAVVSSKTAIDKFEELMAGNEFSLEIIDEYSEAGHADGIGGTDGTKAA